MGELVKNLKFCGQGEKNILGASLSLGTYKRKFRS